MAKLTRKHQKVFAGSATNNGQFGSAQAGTKVTTTDLDTMQALTAFDTGWNDAVISSQKLPPLEEFQALDHIATRQLAYLFQEGIPEYSASCTYYQNSIVKKSGTYELYGSIVDNNTGNALGAQVDTANWKYLGSLASMGGLSAATDAQSNAGALSNVALVPSNFAQQVKSTNGYQKLPSGLIIQWGTSQNTGGSTPVTFPITFPNAVFIVTFGTVATNLATAVNYYQPAYNAQTTSGFNWGSLNSAGAVNTTAATAALYWIAIGY